ncbi:MAG: hypothetical protein Sapg2KO_28800 [Saprospiraceae bacterium]
MPYTAEKTVHFDYQIPDGQTFSRLPPDDIIVELEGVGWDLLYDFLFARNVELTYAPTEDNELPISRNQLQGDIRQKLYSKSLRIRSINSDGIQFSLEDKSQKMVPIRLQSKIQYAQGFQLKGAIKLKPDSVEITGPASYLDTISYWPTDSLILADFNTTLETPLALKTPKDIASITPNTIEVAVAAEQFTQNAIFIPIEIKNSPDSTLRIFPKNISINYIVGISQFNQIDASKFNLIVDFSQTERSNTTNKIDIQLVKQPAEVRNVSFSPKVASYFFVKDTLATQ